MKSKTVKGSRSLKTHEDDDPIFSKKPKVVIRRSAKQNSKIQLVDKEQTTMDIKEIDQVETNLNNMNVVPTVTQTELKASAENPPANQSYPVSVISPQISGFDLDRMSRNQRYALRNMLILCDCCVQTSPDGIFDVLARNFNDTGVLMWWLRRIGKVRIAELVKGKDLVDSVRKAAHRLYRDLKFEIGQPIARW